VPNQLKSLFLLTDVKLKWDKDVGSWYSTEPFGLAICNDKMITRTVTGYIEFTKTLRSDEFRLIIELGNDNYFFFNFVKGKLKTCSSFPAYNEITAGTKSKGDKKEKEDKEKLSCDIIPENESRVYKLIEALENLDIK